MARTREEERWKPRGCSSADSRCAEAVLGVVYRDEGKRSRDPRGIRAGSFVYSPIRSVSTRPISLDRCKFHWRDTQRSCSSSYSTRNESKNYKFLWFWRRNVVFEEYEDWRFEKEINCRYFDSRWWNNSLSNNRILWILVKFLNWTTSKIGCNCFATFKQEFEDQENWRDWRIFYSVSQRRDYKVEILEKNRETNFEKNLKIKKEKGLKLGTKLETLMQCIRRRRWISHWNLHVHQESENYT